METRSLFRALALLGAGGLILGCSPLRNHDYEDSGETEYPPIDPNSKYPKPGPVLATPDDQELANRFSYHEDVITAYGLSYVIKDNDAVHHDLAEITGLKLPEDAGKDKPKVMSAPKTMSLPVAWDSRKQGAGLPPIRNQGSCGSCWAFGTIAAAEAAIAVADKKIVNLSEQFVLDCSGQGTCGGGFWAYNVLKSPGAAIEEEYPYTGYDGSCKSSKVSHPYKIESYHGVEDGDIDAIKAAIYQYGAVGVTMAVCGSFPGYGGGIYDSNECNYYGSNHIVALVGWDDNVAHKKGKGIWIMRNSWGTGWGEDGYARMAYGTAGIEENGTYVIYKPVDPTDTDKDGVIDLYDNCKSNVNPDQTDADLDGSGDACDSKFDSFEKPITLSDDDSRKVDLGFSFSFYGTAYNAVNINSDGNLTFGVEDAASQDRNTSRFLTFGPRIAGLYADLNPAAGGQVVYGKTDPSTFFVRWEKVPVYGKSGTNTVTITLKSSGDISVSVGAVAGTDFIVGVSKGGSGNSASPSDLSAASGALGMANTKAVFEAFGSGKALDLSNKTVSFSLNGGDSPDPGPDPGPAEPEEKALSLDDDDTAQIPLEFEFPYYGKTYSSVYVNSDGNLTFGAGDNATAERSASRFLTMSPRLAVLYGDLNPAAGGTVTYRYDSPTSVTISYKNVPVWGTSVGNSASVTLDVSGKVTLTYGAVGGSTFIVGLSQGGSGNTASSADLSAGGAEISYLGKGATYEAFSKTHVFDLSGKSVTFVPSEGSEPDPGPDPAPSETTLVLGDDDYKMISLPFAFSFFGKSYNEVYVCSDGNLTFGVGDKASSDRSVSRFLTGAPRVALLFADLDPSKGGAVSYEIADANTVLIHYTGVPVWGGDMGNTATVMLKSDGTVSLSMSSIADGSFIVGVSKGGSGNSASESDLDSSGAAMSYGGKGAVYQTFGDMPFVLDGSTFTFKP